MAIVLLSGGQDSTTALFWAFEKYGRKNVIAVSFDYGQRHRVEIAQAEQIAKHCGTHWVLLDAKSLNLAAPSALTRDIEITAPEGKLPSTFVPGRNLFFMVLAAAYGYAMNESSYVIGVSAVDFSGYPDCRPASIKSMGFVLRDCLDRPINIDAPLLYQSKANTVRMAQDNGAIEVMHLTHTCYNGERPACGHCPACKIRIAGFNEAGIPDPLEYK